jgi:hypothetical protein
MRPSRRGGDREYYRARVNSPGGTIKEVRNRMSATAAAAGLKPMGRSELPVRI